VKIRRIRIETSISSLWRILHSCCFSFSNGLSFLKVWISICWWFWCWEFLGSPLINMFWFWNFDMILWFSLFMRIWLEYFIPVTILLCKWQFIFFNVIFSRLTVNGIFPNITSGECWCWFLILILSRRYRLPWRYVCLPCILLINDILFDFLSIFTDFILCCFRNHYSLDDSKLKCS